MKIVLLILGFGLVLSVLGEPPVSRYLPPPMPIMTVAKYGPPMSGIGGPKSMKEMEAAKYQFEYVVKDDGNDFGHRESRDGDLTKGMYFVVLPDGRKQIVEYEADSQGYRPRISYEDAQGNRIGGKLNGSKGYSY